MRRYLALPLAGIIALAVAAPALAGPSVANFSGSVDMAQGTWESYDEDKQAYQFGYVAVSSEQGSSETYAEFNDYREEYVQCTGAATPDDPEDDSFAAVGSRVWGYGPASLTIGKSNSSATASGTLEVTREDFDGCTGEWTVEELADFDFSLDLRATSAAIRETGRGSFHVPGEFNSHSSYKAVYRQAAGTFTGNDGPQTISGMIGTVSWRDHSNG
jgi:hypothetical protein